MRLLFVTNFYPPYALGGYEQRCADVVEALRGKGHDVLVLTTHFGCKGPRVEGNVRRTLPFRLGYFPENYSFWRFVRHEILGVREVKRVLLRHKPEIISVWNLRMVSAALLHVLRGSGIPMTYHFDDDWFLLPDLWHIRWRDYERLGHRLVKRSLRPWIDHRSATKLSSMEGNACAFISEFRKRQYLAAGMLVEGSRVIYGSVAGVFLGERYKEIRKQGIRKLLWCGQVSPHKGTHLAVKALELLHRNGLKHLTLTIVGPEILPGYSADLIRYVTTLGLAGVVTFTGGVERNRLPDVYAQHDAFLFTSCVDEGFPLTILEAMAGGLCVVASRGGGHDELLRDGVNALLFDRYDAGALASGVQTLVNEAGTASRIGAEAVSVIRERFMLQRMVDETAALLADAAVTTGPVGEGPRDHGCAA